MLTTKLIKKGILAAFLAGLALVTSDFASASVIANYPNFNFACGTNGLTCIGNAATTGGVMRVAPAYSGQHGAAYSTSPITLGSNATFSTTFQFRFTNAGGIDPADGITFVLAQNSTGLGGAGGGIGYQGVPNSVAIEFDTFNNGSGDNNSSNEVGIDVNGSLNSIFQVSPYAVTTCDFYSGYLKPGCLSNGDVWTATIGYDGTYLTGTVQDGASAPQTLINNYPIDIASDLGTNTAYVGFTSATGAGWENHDILNWQFANDISLAPPQNQVPEPGTIALIGLGLVGLIGSRRRSRSH